jgi:hypothetical protein
MTPYNPKLMPVWRSKWLVIRQGWASVASLDSSPPFKHIELGSRRLPLADDKSMVKYSIGSVAANWCMLTAGNASTLVQVEMACLPKG